MRVSSQRDQAGVRQLRKDARANRERILSAARDVFIEEGPDAPLERICTRALVGKGTLYRHYPTKQHLVEELFRESVLRGTSIYRRAQKAADPAEGFDQAIRELGQWIARDGRLSEIIISRSLGTTPVKPELRANIAALRKLINRAKESGAIRSDIEPADVYFLFWCLGRVVPAVSEVAPGAWERFVELVLQAFHQADVVELPWRALDDKQLLEAMTRVVPGNGPRHDASSY
jgi:AcrR family transcriptional regulator